MKRNVVVSTPQSSFSLDDYHLAGIKAIITQNAERGLRSKRSQILKEALEMYFERREVSPEMIQRIVDAGGLRKRKQETSD